MDTVHTYLLTSDETRDDVIDGDLHESLLKRERESEIHDGVKRKY